MLLKYIRQTCLIVIIDAAKKWHIDLEFDFELIYISNNTIS